MLQPVSVLPSQCGDLNGTSLLSWMGIHGVWDWDKAKLVRVQSIVRRLRLLLNTGLAFTIHPFTWEVLALRRQDSHSKLPMTSLLRLGLL